MAEREGLGDLPTFDLERLPERDMVIQEEREEDDYQYITKMYPSTAREILEMIEDLCDQLEYEGSRLFDEYMDRTSVMAMADQIYDKVKYHEKEPGEKRKSLLYQLVIVLLGGEMCHRRCRYRRKKRMFS